MLKRMIMLYLNLAVVTAVLMVFAANGSAQVPADAEARLRAIYEQREFSARSFRGTWLSDSSGYTVSEVDPETNQQVQVRYNVVTGKRTVMDLPRREETRSRRSGNTSPDGRVTVYSDQGNLHVRDLRSDRTVRLTNNAVSGSISNGSAIWSPDSKWIAFMETDRSGVPFRASLIPSDPTYPEVRQSRYARVGETIATSRDGKEQALLTPGDYDIIEFARIDESCGWFYYYASPDNATQKYLHRARLDGSGRTEQITPANQPGTHKYNFSPDFKWAFHTYSTFDTPPVTELVKLPEHKVLRVLEDNKELSNKMKKFITRPTEFLQLDIGGSVVMDAWMIKPRNFDPSKKYPVFIYVYSEPHGQTVLDAWGRNHADYHRVIADLGYLVVSMDSRGTPAPKGAAWRRAEFPTLGVLSIDDQAAGIKELGRIRPYVDLSRVGIWGWSGGGSNTLNAMFRKPDVYHLGIAVAPKPQPHLYNAWFQEIYMRTLEKNPDGYHKSAPINFAQKLKGDLLIIHGTGETNTHLEITEGLVDRLIELGKQFDYFTYPNRDHGISRGKGTSLHLRMLMTRYLLTHLPAGPR